MTGRSSGARTSTSAPFALTIVLGTAGALGLAAAILIAGYTYDPPAIVLATVASALLIAIPIAPWSPERRIRGWLATAMDRWRPVERRVAAFGSFAVAVTVLSAIAAGLAATVVLDSLPRGMLVVVLMLIAGGLVVPLPGRVAWPVGMIATLVAGASLITSHTPPGNDVWNIVQGGTDAILAGLDPYDQCWQASPDPSTACVYSYLPMTSLLLAPFRVAFGDIRFGLLGALVVTSWVTFRLAHPRVAVPLSLALIPLGLILVDRAWTEPLLMAALAIIVLSTERGHPAIGVLALALALATKQHVWLLLPLLAWWPAFGIKRAILAAGLAVGMTLPFVLGAPGAFMDDAVWFLLRLPPRQDSVSLAAIALADGIDIPTVIALALVASIVVLVGIRAPRTALGFLTGVAATLAAFDLVNKQSFFNYHALVIAVTTLAIADATPWLATMDEPVLVAVSAPQASEPASSPANAGP